MEIVIAGGGIAGLSAAWFLARKGVQVKVYEKGKIGQGATWRAAGMLAPVNELEFNELELLKAGLAGREIYSEMEDELGDIGLIKTGTLEVALTRDDAAYLRRFYEYQKENGLNVEWISGVEARKLEPFLSQQIPNAIWSPDDIQLDNRKLVKELRKKIEALGGEVIENAEMKPLEGKGAYLLTINGKEVSLVADQVLWTVGAWQKQDELQVFPVRGEMLCLEPPKYPFLEKTIRIRNRVLGNAYIVPKADRIVCGATSEERGMDQNNTAGGVLDILRKCYAAVPGIYELNVLELDAGLRPATLNRQPILQMDSEKNYSWLNGLYRHGILLGPLAGKSMADLLMGEPVPEAMKSFVRNLNA